MVSSTCSSASIESAPAGFPGLLSPSAVAPAAAAAAAATAAFIDSERPVSVDVGYGSSEHFVIDGLNKGSGRGSKELALLLSMPPKMRSSSSSSSWFDNKGYRNNNNKRTLSSSSSSSSKLASISKRGRFDSSYKIAADFYPFPRCRRRRFSLSNGANFDLRQLRESFKEFERQNRRKALVRYFDC